MNVVSRQLIEPLRELGFTRYEASSYAVLAVSGPLSASEVADLTNVPRPRAYDTLEKLLKKEYIRIEEINPVRYGAIHPRELEARIEREEKEKEENIMQAGEEMTEILSPFYDSSAPKQDVSYAIKGRDNIKKKMLSMLEGAGNIRIITSYYHSVILKDDAILEKLKKTDHRVITNEEIKLETSDMRIFPIREKFAVVIVDSKKVLIVTVEGDEIEYNAGCYIEDHEFGAGFESMYDFIWKQI